MTTRKQVVNRLKRARGQLDSLIDHIENGDTNCRDMLTQFAAVNSAMRRASYLAVATIMSQCAIEDARAENAPASECKAVESRRNREHHARRTRATVPQIGLMRRRSQTAGATS